MKILIRLSLLVLLVSESTAQTKSITYQAYLSNSKELWTRAISASSNDMSKVLAQYGLLNYTMSSKDEKTFEAYYDSTIEELERLSDSENEAVCTALMSSIYGYAIAHDSWKGMYLGPKSGTLITSAYAKDPQNPLVVKLYASSKLYTPSMFGGDLEEALRGFEKSVKLFEESGDTVSNWMYLDALAHLGIAQSKLNKKQEAFSTFEKAIAIEQNFYWVSKNLLPAIQTK